MAAVTPSGVPSQLSENNNSKVLASEKLFEVSKDMVTPVFASKSISGVINQAMVWASPERKGLTFAEIP